MQRLNLTSTLIAFYSRSGNNYVAGNIVNLKVGNTKVAAQMIHEVTGGDLFQIDAISPYPEDYHQTTAVARKELRENTRPELTDQVQDMSKYEGIFLGYPNWWGTMPMAVYTFLESYDFTGKIIVPFCTHEGSGMGHSQRDIKKICPKATVTKGLALFGSQVQRSKPEIVAWLDTRL